MSETEKDKEFPLLTDIHIPMLNLSTDSIVVIKEQEKRDASKFYHGSSYYDGWDDDDDFYGSYYDDGISSATASSVDTEGWKKFYNGFGMTDEEWDEWQRDIAEYENALKTFENRTGIKIRNGEDGKKKKGVTSQKFINGIEVDDEIFEAYNSRKKNKNTTRRGGKKHKSRTTEIINGVTVVSSSNNKRKTRYVDDDWWDSHERDRDAYESQCEDELKDEEKTIVFYRNLPDENDTYEWDNIYEFNEWLEENEIDVPDAVAYDIVYASESHCCLNPDTTSKELIAERSYNDLTYRATNGDLSILEDPSNHWNYHKL